ncbi:hypothetical protein ColLi_08500 [Colletotrichum liriopes]|uniref:Uncharacterized protein n=1 Tax=Colletotrichum liriopes TaxID=708192 RepID=A0AA37LV63_9PEZI|nr:hypothetical protein ColLi_08500 [Colletotrichum liriopes]
MSTSSQRATFDWRDATWKFPHERESDEDYDVRHRDVQRQLVAAFDGKMVPENLHSTAEYCIVHGIRHHEGFARSPAVTKLCSSEKGSGLYARARNARLIMSNTVPEMPSDAVKPYCIWYPGLATEETYRELASRYPDMRYHVGRACAVAGYDNLYNELNLLPDVSIAEEARDNGHTAIFQAIVSQNMRYAVMDDYTRTVNLKSPRAGAYLNGDTAVRSTLPVINVEHPADNGSHYYLDTRQVHHRDDHYFDIQEDAHISTTGFLNSDVMRLESKFVDLVWKPLSQDLPTMKKDVLIVAAAWDGNMDRYQRLRRPKTVSNELSAVIRGAYHHTPFARWLDTCLDSIFHKNEAWYVRQAVHARFIMNNDLSRINTDTDGDDLPAIFWWPHIPHENTLRGLAWRRSDMKHQVTLACIVANYRELFDELQAGLKPTQWQWEVACQSTNTHYHETVKRRAAEENVRLTGCPASFDCSRSDRDYWSRAYLRPNKEPSSGEQAYMPSGLCVTSDFLEGNWDEDPDWDSWEDAPGDLLDRHTQRQMAEWATFISATNEARRRKGTLYSSRADVERRKTPAPEPKLRKDFSSLDDIDEDIGSWEPPTKEKRDRARAEFLKALGL